MRALVVLSLTIASGLLLALAPAYAQVSSAVPVPEPASWTIMAVAIGGAAIAARHKRRK